MKKIWWKSKTVWGGILLSVEAGLLVAKGNFVGVAPYIEIAIVTLGTFLTVFGFRDGMK